MTQQVNIYHVELPNGTPTDMDNDVLIIRHNDSGELLAGINLQDLRYRVDKACRDGVELSLIDKQDLRNILEWLMKPQHVTATVSDEKEHQFLVNFEEL